MHLLRLRECTLDDKGREIDRKSKIDENVVHWIKGLKDQKQFELNAELDPILECIDVEIQRAKRNFTALIREASLVSFLCVAMMPYEGIAQLFKHTDG